MLLNRDDLPRLKKLRVQTLRDELEAAGIDNSGTIKVMLDRVAAITPSDTRTVESEPHIPTSDENSAEKSTEKDTITFPKKDVPKSDSPAVKKALSEKQLVKDAHTTNDAPKNTASSVLDQPNNTVNDKNKKKQRRKRRPIEVRVLEDPSMRTKMADVEVEYLAPTPAMLGLKETETNYQEFSRIFDKFTLPDPSTADQEQDTEIQDAEELESDPESDLEGEMETEEERISKKKQRKANRMSVAELKQLALKPDVVEWVDVTAPDPLFLVHLKGLKNTVPVPVHWSQKRRYLAGKRGVEKMAYQLPEYIADTGIGAMREAVAEKESAMTAKAKARSKTQPKLGKIDIDYQKLHDAFFRFQTKPHLSIHGDVYYEGKEFEIRLTEKKPGVLSEELREALGMTSPLVPPPWLINQQRYGPPVSYTNLKIPGLNAPIPEGCVLNFRFFSNVSAQWGFHPGGWGRPPVDEFNQPLYGDVFGLYQQYQQRLQSAIEASNLMNPIEKETFGVIEEPDFEAVEEHEPDEEEQEEQEAEEELEPAPQIDIRGLQTPSGLASVAAGVATPQVIPLRKKRRFADTAVESIDVSLNPEDFKDGVPTAAALREKLSIGKQDLNVPKEDLSDMVAEHGVKQAANAALKKRRLEESSGGDKAQGKKPRKEFKF